MKIFRPTVYQIARQQLKELDKQSKSYLHYLNMKVKSNLSNSVIGKQKSVFRII